jgi:hypothetical protein
MLIRTAVQSTADNDVHLRMMICQSQLDDDLMRESEMSNEFRLSRLCIIKPSSLSPCTESLVNDIDTRVIHIYNRTLPCHLQSHIRYDGFPC